MAGRAITEHAAGDARERFARKMAADRGHDDATVSPARRPAEPASLRPPGPGERGGQTVAAQALLQLQRTAGNQAAQRVLARRAAPTRRLSRVLDERIVRGMRGGPLLDESEYETVRITVEHYNRLCPGADTRGSLHERMRALDAIEHVIYRWFERTRVRLRPDDAALRADPGLLGMFELMTAVQRDHAELVRRVASTGEQIWVHDDPGSSERAEIDALWNNIVSGTGAFRYAPQVVTAKGVMEVRPQALERFKGEILAGLARLLSRPRGRMLLQALQGGDPRDATRAAVTFAIPALYKLLGMRDFDQSAPYVSARAEHVDSLGARPVTGPGGMTRGPGSPAVVDVAPGLRDSSMMDFAPEGTPVLSPAFVGIGHELIPRRALPARRVLGQDPRAGPASGGLRRGRGGVPHDRARSRAPGCGRRPDRAYGP